MSDVVLLAPMDGWLTPLDEVPDPVFAERMMGDGIAIDPLEGLVRSPADATVVSISDSAHAVTLRLANGAELLIHIGLETVALGGAGFRALTSNGAQVKTGDSLIEVDLASVGRDVRSLVTPIVIANDGFELLLEPASRRVRAGEKIGMVRGNVEAAGVSSGDLHERTVRIDAAHGLHARPAARIAALTRQYVAEVGVQFGERTAPARSTVALMGLGIKQGEEVRLTARGSDAAAALDALVKLITTELGEEPAISAAPVRRAGPVCASPGLAIGTIVQIRASDLQVPENGVGIEAEAASLNVAMEAAASDLHGGGSANDLAAAHRELLHDPELLARANAEIADGRSAAFAWRTSCASARGALVATGDPLLAERAADLLDIERQVIAKLVGSEAVQTSLPADAIIVASDLLPSEFLSLDKARVAGICTTQGGPTSHVAILAAAVGLPMIVGAGPDVLNIADGSPAILDADRCKLEASPSARRLTEARAEVARRREKYVADVHDAQQSCFTADGTRIEIFANLASVSDAADAVRAGAEGCGLLRTEFLAIGRDSAPDEAEQAEAYTAIAAALGDRPLIIRTFDIGADKKVSYLATGDEENPALGLRGVRLSLARPDLMATQMRAILRGVPASQRKIMLPMISDVQEFRDARAALREAEAAVGAEAGTPLGIMVETPASAILADELAAEADFLSVGTNDLAQYVLAADRTNSGVSAMLDGFHPAVLRLIRTAAQGAQANKRWIGVCGGLASDPLAVPILIGLGVTELSAAPAAVPSIKAVVRRMSMGDCRAVAERACSAGSAHDVRTIAAEALA